MVGDLREAYRSPRQYAQESLRTVPLVVLSQMRRNLNLPALLLQSGLVYFCLGPVATSLAVPSSAAARHLSAHNPPCPRRALRAAILVASVALVFLQAMSLTMGAAIHSGLDRATWMSLLFVGPMLSPLMGLFRAGLIVDGDQRHSACGGKSFGCRNWRPPITVSRTGRAGTICWRAPRCLPRAASLFFFLRGTVSVPLIGLYILAAFYLLLHGAPARCCNPADFVSLRAHFQGELTRRQRQRGFLWWLWFAPVLAALYFELVEGMLADGKPMLAVVWKPSRRCCCAS